MSLFKASISVLIAFTCLAALSGCGGSGSGDTSESATAPTNSSGAVSLNWTPPIQNMDGSYLTDLAGYNIYYGLNEREYTTRINIDNPGITSFVVSNLSPNTYFFAATAYNAAGVESPYSAEVIKVVD